VAEVKRKAGSDLQWDQYIDYCARHKAETDIFPLGLLAGYPATVDFQSLHDRVLEDSVVKAILTIMDHPRDHPSFMQCEREVKRDPRWASSRSPQKSLTKLPG
jgi:hypothetical protein